MPGEGSVSEISLKIGNEPVRIFSDHQAFIHQTRIGYANFAARLVHPCINIHVDVCAGGSKQSGLPDMDHPDVRFDPLKEDWILNWTGLRGRYCLKSNAGWIRNGVNPAGLNSFLRFVFSLALIRKSGCLVHASSLIKNGEAYLFPGKSGAGKTTITRISPDTVLLSDDISLIRASRAEFMAFGTPFFGAGNMPGENRAAPLKGIYFPVKDKANYLDKLNPGQALQRLLSNAVFFARDPDLSRRLFDFCADIAMCTPAYDLHFLPESSFWRCIDDG